MTKTALNVYTKTEISLDRPATFHCKPCKLENSVRKRPLSLQRSSDSAFTEGEGTSGNANIIELVPSGQNYDEDVNHIELTPFGQRYDEGVDNAGLAQLGYQNADPPSPNLFAKRNI